MIFWQPKLIFRGVTEIVIFYLVILLSSILLATSAIENTACTSGSGPTLTAQRLVKKRVSQYLNFLGVAGDKIDRSPFRDTWHAFPTRLSRGGAADLARRLSCSDH